MVDSSADTTSATPDVEASAAEGGTKRQRSTIAFPYVPLQDVVEMVFKVESRGHRCRVEELAADLDQQMTSGAFRSRLSAGRMFGVSEVVRGDISLTDLGQTILNPDTRADALAEAFLRVPLYEKIYTKFAGGKLPPDQGIEAEMIRLGVPRKQVQKARQVLVRSADEANYFRSGRDRLVRPPATSMEGVSSPVHAPEEPVTSRREAAPMADHPLIKGLVAKLPAEGERFSARQRQRWLEAAKVNLELIYAIDDDEADVAPAMNNAAASEHLSSLGAN